MRKGPRDEYPAQDFCGCCGRRYRGQDNSFCGDCLKHVTEDRGQDDWDRTYFAQHGEDCPFQVDRYNPRDVAILGGDPSL